MELQIRVTPQEAGRLSVSVTQDRLELEFGAGRRVSFEGDFGDIAVKLLTEGESLPLVTMPASSEEADREAQVQSSPLFEQLVALRRQIASESGLAPFIIFHDSALLEMCRMLPMDLKELKAIPGVGEAKLTRYGQRFLDIIREYATSGH